MTKNKKIIFRLLGILTTSGALLTNSCLAKEIKSLPKEIKSTKYTTRGSKITDGTGGRIFEDSNGHIGAMGAYTGLQVLTKNKDGSFAGSGSTDPNHRLLRGSNINNGVGGVIFEDSSGNLGSMGAFTPLQVLVKKQDGSYATSWHSHRSSGLTNGSNIHNGGGGQILQDSSGNLWAMGADSALQVLIKKADGTFAKSGTSDTSRGLLKGSKILKGAPGKIFKDSSGNLGALGKSEPLQVLEKKGNGAFAKAGTTSTKNGLLRGLIQVKDYRGFRPLAVGSTIFEDSKDNIGYMGYGTPLQVLVKNEDGSYAQSGHSDKKSGLTKDSNITDGYFGTIFEDSSGNIGAMGNRTSLQVLVKNEDGNYENSGNSAKAQKLLAGSNIKSGTTGIVFEDKNDNIFSIGYKTPLQVLAKKQAGSFAPSGTSDKNHPLLKGSNIDTSKGTSILQDSNGNIGAVVPGGPIQVG